MHAPEPDPAEGIEHIDVAPVGDEGEPVADPGLDPGDTYVEGVDADAT